MKIVFVDNLLLERSRVAPTEDLQPHLGLISLIGLVESGGHEGVLYDPKLALARGEISLDQSLYHRIARAILEYEPDAVGFTSLGCSFICSLQTAACLKAERRLLPILLGGPHATILYEQILRRFEVFDVVVRHEAESLILPLLEGLCQHQIDDVPGIAFRSGDKVIATTPAPLIKDLDSLPFPAFDHYPIAEVRPSVMRIEVGRGCPFHCTFCSTASFFGRQYRLKSPARICAEMDHVAAAYGIRQFSLTHDLFTVNRKKVIEFCDYVWGRGYAWSCSARMDCVDRQLLEHMAAAGCRAIYFGVETGSPRMQRITLKNQDLELYTPTLDIVRGLRLGATVSFITGYPEETQEDQGLTLDLIGATLCRSDERLETQLHLLTPEPGTELLTRNAASLDYDGYVTDFNFPSLDPRDDNIMRDNADVFVNHHFYRATLPRDRHIFVSSAVEELQALGLVVLRYILGRYGNRLSTLVDSLYEWKKVHLPSQVGCDASLLVAYAMSSWTVVDPACSLLRYMTTVNRMSASLPTSPRCERLAVLPKGRIASANVVAAAGLAVLRDLHDCGTLLSNLSQKKGQSSAVGELSHDRNDWAVVVSSERVVRNILLTRYCGELLEFCTMPRSVAEIVTVARLRWNVVDGEAAQAVCDLVGAGLLSVCVGGRRDSNAPKDLFCSSRTSVN